MSVIVCMGRNHASTLRDRHILIESKKVIGSLILLATLLSSEVSPYICYIV